MKIFYISPSRLPSRSANSIHVVRMCEAFASLGHDVKLFVNRTGKSHSDLKDEIQRYYGVSLDRINVSSFYSPVLRAMNLQIALYSVTCIMIEIIKGNLPELIISRNPFATYLMGKFVKCRIIHESHQIDYGFRKHIQKQILANESVVNVVISKALLDCLIEHHGFSIKNAIILHDAAVEGIEPLSLEKRLKIRSEIMPDDENDCLKIAGYFGHLYKGRGIEIIQGLAERIPEVVFVVYGGNKEQIDELREFNKLSNLRVMGYVEPGKVQDIMNSMDILLMPYQRNVSIGTDDTSDTGKYMSPMKMFEYMASGVPMISSKLPVLEEVLEHERNCLLAECDDIEDWRNCVDRLLKDKSLYDSISRNSSLDYKNNYTWKTRAKRMIESCYS